MTVLLSWKRWVMINEFAQVFSVWFRLLPVAKWLREKQFVRFIFSIEKQSARPKWGFSLLWFLLEATPRKIHSDHVINMLLNPSQQVLQNAANINEKARWDKVCESAFDTIVQVYIVVVLVLVMVVVVT